MTYVIVVCFLLVFFVATLATGIGMKYLETQKRRKVTQMLETRIGDPALQDTTVLIEAPSSNSGLAAVAENFEIGRRMEAQIQQAGVNWSLNSLLMAMVALTVPGALIGAKLNPLMSPELSALVCAVVTGVLPYLNVLNKRKKRLALFEEQFPEALDFLSRSMRAGHAFSVSLEMLSDESPQPLAMEIRKVFNEQNLGLPIETALQNFAVRMPSVDVRFFVSAVLLQKETGGNLAEILTKLAYIIRERFKLKGQVKAASAHGRVTGAVLTLMPVVLMLALMVVSPDYLKKMALNPVGKYMIGGAIAGLLMGHITIRKIVDIRV